MTTRNRILWAMQWVLGLFFVYVGVMHFVVPDGLPGPLEWMYDLSDTQHYVAGTAEILGGLGLILPWLTGIVPRLTPLAAVGLVVVMIGAIVWHVGRDEPLSIANNAFLAVVLAYVAYGRWTSEQPPVRLGGRR